jgi:hypothetical protein
MLVVVFLSVSMQPKAEDVKFWIDSTWSIVIDSRPDFDIDRIDRARLDSGGLVRPRW